YRDRLGGIYEAVPLAVLPAGATPLGVFDMNNDGSLDLAVGDSTGLTLLMNDRKGGFRGAKAPAGARAPFGVADLENRAVSEPVAAPPYCATTAWGHSRPPRNSMVWRELWQWRRPTSTAMGSWMWPS